MPSGESNPPVRPWDKPRISQGVAILVLLGLAGATCTVVSMQVYAGVQRAAVADFLTKFSVGVFSTLLQVPALTPTVGPISASPHRLCTLGPAAAVHVYACACAVRVHDDPVPSRAPIPPGPLCPLRARVTCTKSFSRPGSVPCVPWRTL
jgi:hypothetical protein